MKRIKTVRRTDLNQLAKDVLSRGRLAALPSNLSDNWLRVIGRDILGAEKANLQGKEEVASEMMLGPLLLVSALHAHGSSKDSEQIDISMDEVQQRLKRFSAAVVNEILGRETGVFMRQYNIDDIV